MSYQNCNLITEEIKFKALEKSDSMPLGTYTRLKLSDGISNIVIQTSSSGVWIHNVTGVIDESISTKIICFIPYNKLSNNLT